MDVFDRALRDPGGLALDDGARRRTWGELGERAARWSAVLRDHLGALPGDRVASVMGNRVEWFELALGALAAGVWLVPVNTHLHPDEVEHVLEDAGVGAAIVEAGFGSRVGARSIVTLGDPADALLDRLAPRPIDRAGPPGGRMHYTSGTSGRPKGVVRALPPTVGDYLEALGRMGRAVGLDGSGPHLVTGPHYHAAVGGYALFDLCNGAPLVLMERFEAAAALEAMTRWKIAHTHLVPTMFVRLLRLPEAQRARFDPSSLRLVLHGAAPVTAEVKRAMIDWWGPVLVEYWGASEAGTFTTCTSSEWLERPGTVGRALPGVEVVVGDEHARPLPPQSTGLLWCRFTGGERPFAYHRDEPETAAAYGDGGWFTSGDIGRIDRDGYVWLLGRASSTIITGGVNVYPAQVEAALLRHPAVDDAAVFGVPDPEWGEQVKAAVQLTGGRGGDRALEAELIEHVRSHLARYKAPRSIDFVDRLPRLPSGKLLTRELKDPYWDGRVDRGDRPDGPPPRGTR